MWLHFVIEESHRLRVEVQRLEEVRQNGLIVLQEVHVVVGKIHPNLNSVERLIVFGRNEPEAADVLAVLEIFSQEEKDKVGVEFILVLLIPVDGENEAASLFITGILPFGFNALLEIFNRVDPTPFILNQVATLGKVYLFC